MKITHNKVGQNLNLVDTNKADRSDAAKASKLQNSKASLLEASGASAQNGATKVDVSDRALEAKRIKELAMSAPDVDMAKVEKFRNMIDSGNYKVDARAVADKMVDDHLEMTGAQE